MKKMVSCVLVLAALIGLMPFAANALLWATPFDNERAFIGSGSYYYCIDKNGNALWRIKDIDTTGVGFLNGVVEVYDKIAGTYVVLNASGEMVVSPEKQNFKKIVAVLPEQGWILVYGVKSTFTGDTHQLGVMDLQGNWLLPLSEEYGDQEHIAYIGHKGRRMRSQFYEGKILLRYDDAYAPMGMAVYLFDVQNKQLAELTDGSLRFAGQPWKLQYARLNHKVKAKDLYFHAEGSLALDPDDIKKKYPTFDGSSDFVGEYAGIRFNSGSAKFFGLIDKKLNLLFEPIEVPGMGSFGVLDEGRAYYASKGDVYITDYSGNTLMVISDADGISSFSGGIAILRQDGPPYAADYDYSYVFEDGSRIPRLNDDNVKDVR